MPPQQFRAVKNPSRNSHRCAQTASISGPSIQWSLAAVCPTSCRFDRAFVRSVDFTDRNYGRCQLTKVTPTCARWGAAISALRSRSPQARNGSRMCHFDCARRINSGDSEIKMMSHLGAHRTASPARFAQPMPSETEATGAACGPHLSRNRRTGNGSFAGTIASPRRIYFNRIAVAGEPLRRILQGMGSADDTP